MPLVIQKKANGFEYASIRESFWDPVRKKYSSRTIKNYGRLDLALKLDPHAREKMEAEALAYKQSRADEKQRVLKERVSHLSVAASRTVDGHADNRTVMLGSCVYRQIWNKLDLQRKCRDLIKNTGIEFNFAEAVFYMTAARSLMPDSKLGQWEKRNQFLYGASRLRLNHLYRSVTLLCRHKSSIVSYLNKQISKHYQRAVSVVLYDVTTYAFESQDVDALRAFGFSKDCKVNEVQVVMGLLIDDRGIPIDYELFPGNTNEFGTMVPLLEKLRKKYGIEKVIVTADRGLNSGANLLAIKKLGMQYVIAYRLKSAGETIRRLIADDNGWQRRNANGIGNADVSRYKISTETRQVRIVAEDGSVKRETITSNLLINYSARRARKDAGDRQRLIDKAERYAENPSLLRSDMRRGGKSYLKIDADKLNVQVDAKRIENAEFFDGYYGIAYSDASLTPEDVLAIHHSLWQIEESFRISKSLLKARPCFHWTETRIRGHFLICFMALVLHRLLELELADKDVKLTSEEIIDALSEALLLEARGTGAEPVYCKANTEGHFEIIAEAVGLGKLASLANAADVKRALHLREL